jgi:hypothetical protein
MKDDVAQALSFKGFHDARTFGRGKTSVSDRACRDTHCHLTHFGAHLIP